MIDSKWKDLIEKRIRDFLSDIRLYSNEELYNGMEYALLSGGKRVRPILMLISADILSVDTQDVIDLALALELIHTYSLIHDDLPAMDNDDFRRGKATCHKVFGEDMAILIGDALLNSAMECIIGLINDKPYTARAGLYLAKNAGISGMIGGQAIDIRVDNDNCNRKLINQMVTLKTGKLIQSALVCPCLISNNSAELNDFSSIGENIGLAFQVVDDILDYKDEDSKKANYVNTFGMDYCKQLLKNLEQENLLYLDKYKAKGNELKVFMHNLTTRTY